MLERIYDGDMADILHIPQPEPIQPAPHPREERRANVAIVLSVVAIICAGGAWYESHRQGNIAQNALDLAKKSADEQKSDVERSRKAAEGLAEATKASIAIWQQAASASDRTSRTLHLALQNAMNSFRAEFIKGRPF